jgi:ribosome recycling factor
MSNKNYRSNSNDKFTEFKDEFEDFGYDVKNVKRQSKKKVTKFKTKDDWYEDSF